MIIQIEKFITDIRATFPEAAANDIARALAEAQEKLSDLTRYDGTPFLLHGVGVARIVFSEIGLGRSSVMASLLHDVARLGRTTLDEIAQNYGQKCAGMVAGMCNISEVDPKVAENQTDNYKELILSYSTDPRVILIKIADRLEVMRSIAAFPPDKRVTKSRETLNVYSQLAHKLGLYGIKSELEDLALRYLEPQSYNYISDHLKKTDAERSGFIDKFSEPIRRKLDEAGIRYTIKGRTKSIYSIWRKMKKYHVGINEVYDLFAIRVIIECAPEQEKQLCWNIYSIVTDFYTPNPDRLRDWISIPKSNGYESLHTTVVTPQGRWVEVQIRSERMDEVAEHGVAAHWRYKGVSSGAIGSEEWLQHVRSLIESGVKDSEDASGFNISLTIKEVFAFTPTGDLRKLSEGATVLDFAFDIHTNVGLTCTGARVNHRNVTLKYKLRNGDVVEVLTAKNQKPKADWLNIVTTSKARSRIKAFLREEQAKNASLGREELERKLKNWKITLPIDDITALLMKSYKIKTTLELFDRIAEEQIDIAEVKEIITTSIEHDGDDDLPKPPIEVTLKESKKESSDCLLIDEHLQGVDYKFAKCCNPIYGDDVFGFVTVSSGITIHRDSCPNAARLKSQYGYRVICARWRETTSVGAFRANIRITGKNSVGLLNKITELLNKELKINIGSMQVSTSADVFTGDVSVEVKSTKMLDSVIHNLLKIKEIDRVVRIK